jgi:hypothetical protein
MLVAHSVACRFDLEPTGADYAVLDFALFYVFLTWLVATIILILDLRSLRGELAGERAERLATEQQRKLTELTLARFAHERHQEVIGILRANIIPDRAPSAAPPEQDDAAAQGDDSPKTPREPAVARSQRPPAPSLSFPEPPTAGDIWSTEPPREQGAA